MPADVQQMLEQIQAKSAETHQMVADFQARDKAREAEMKGAIARQDGVLTEVQTKLADAISANAEAIQKLEGAVADAQKQHNAVEELKYFGSTLQPSSKEARDHFKSFLKSGLTDLQSATALHGMMQKDLSVNDNPNGGFLVPAQTASFIANRVFEGDALRGLARQETITSGDALVIPLDDEDFGASWTGETQARSNTSNATLGELRIDVHEVYASVPMTLKIIEDANVDIERWVSEKAADKFSRTEGSAFISGDGVGKPRGILTYTAASNSNTYQRGAIGRLNLGSNSVPTADGLIRLQNLVKEPFQANGNFLMKRTTYGECMVLKDSQGRYLFNSMPNSDGVFRPTLLSKPVSFSDSMPAVATGALSIAYGDFRAGYCIVDRVGMSVLRDPYSQQGYVVAKMRKRVGGGVINFDAFKIGVIAA